MQLNEQTNNYLFRKSLRVIEKGKYNIALNLFYKWKCFLDIKAEIDAFLRFIAREAKRVALTEGRHT